MAAAGVSSCPDPAADQADPRQPAAARGRAASGTAGMTRTPSIHAVRRWAAASMRSAGAVVARARAAGSRPRPPARWLHAPTARPPTHTVGPALPLRSNSGSRCGPRYQPRSFHPMIVGSSAGQQRHGLEPVRGGRPRRRVVEVVGEDPRRRRRIVAGVRRDPTAPTAASAARTSRLRPLRPPREVVDGAGPVRPQPAARPARPGPRRRVDHRGARRSSRPSAPTGTGSTATIRAAGPGRCRPSRRQQEQHPRRDPDEALVALADGHRQLPGEVGHELGQPARRQRPVGRAAPPASRRRPARSRRRRRR